MNFCDLPPQAQIAIWRALERGADVLQGWVCGVWPA
jgi:hypothetical protein